MTVAMSAPATPGAIAVRLAEFARAMPENVSITPHTVPSRPMNGPPATAVERTIMPFSSASASPPTVRSSATRTDSKGVWLMGVFRDDDRPTEQRDDDQRADGELAFGGRLLERELERAAGEDGSSECEHDV